jgi:hypothetical protein
MKNIDFFSKKHGKYTVIVDDVDYERLKGLKNMKWCVSIKRNNLVYFQKRFSNLKIKELHRWIMNDPKGKYVDHINKNTLDNRRENLRVCNNSANLRNGKIRPNNKSGFTGVFQKKDKWGARIRVMYKTVYLGYYDTFDKAVNARKKAEIKYFNV